MSVYVGPKTRTIYAEVRGRDGEPVQAGPKAIMVVVDDASVARIKRHAQCAADHDFCRVQSFASPVWLDKIPVHKDGKIAIKEFSHQVAVETLNVSSDDFWYEAYLDGTITHILSEHILISSIDD